MMKKFLLKRLQRKMTKASAAKIIEMCEGWEYSILRTGECKIYSDDLVEILRKTDTSGGGGTPANCVKSRQKVETWYVKRHKDDIIPLIMEFVEVNEHIYDKKKIRKLLAM